MADVLEFEVLSLRNRFRKALANMNLLPLPEENAQEEDENYEIKTTGQAVFTLYRQERVRQGYEEFRWESLDVAQRLVWQW